jgi:hypothetical protein
MKKIIITETQLRKILLFEDFKTQRVKFIEQGYDERIVDTYLKDFNDLRNAKYKEAAEIELPGLNVPQGEARFNIDNYKSFKELEILIDYIAGVRKFGSANFTDIEVDGKPIFENDEVQIFYADTPRACIEYKGNKPYSWCISRNDSGNMYYNYRLGDTEPAFYFVKLTKRMEKEFSMPNRVGFKDKYHFFVLQVTNNNKYIVTSASNDGDKPMKWEEILQFAPELSELKEIFKHVPLTSEKRQKIEKYQKGLSDIEFKNLPYVEKDFFMSVFVQNGNLFSFEKFQMLPNDLKNKYIGLGVGLTNEQYELIKNDKKLFKRYKEVTEKKFDSLNEIGILEASNFIKSEQLLLIDKIREHIKNNYKTSIESYEIEQLLEFKYIRKDVVNAIIEFKTNEIDLHGISEIWRYVDDESSDKYIEYMIESFYKEFDYDFYSEKRKIINELLVYSTKPIKIIEKLIEYLGKYVDYNFLDNTLLYVKNKSEYIKLYIKVKGNEIDHYDLSIIFIDHGLDENVLKDIIDYIIEEKIELDTLEFELLMRREIYQDKIVDYYLTNKILDNDTFEIILKYYNKKYEFALEYVENYDHTISNFKIETILENIKDNDELANKILDLKIDNLDFEVIYTLVTYSSNKTEIINRIIEIEKNKLGENSIHYILVNTLNIQDTINNLLKNGISKEIINNGIKLYNELRKTSEKIPLLETKLHKEVYKIKYLISII